MNKSDSIETLINTSNVNVSDQTKFRLNEINKIKDYFSLKYKKERQ